MTAETARLCAAGFALLWLISGILALRRMRLPAVLIIVAITAPAAVLTVSELGRALFNRDAFINRYGQAALGQLPSDAALLAIAVLAIAGSLYSLNGRRLPFLVAWLAGGALTAAFIYLAFFFRIF